MIAICWQAQKLPNCKGKKYIYTDSQPPILRDGMQLTLGWVFTYVYMCVCVHVRMRVGTCVCMWVCVCVYMCVSMYI